MKTQAQAQAKAQEAKIHSDFGDDTLCVSKDERGRWGVLSREEIEEARERGEEIEELPGACCIECDLETREALIELDADKKIVSYDDIGIVYDSVEDAQKALKDLEESVTEIELEDLKDFSHEEYDLVMLRATFEQDSRTDEELIEAVKSVISSTIEQKEEYQSEDGSEIDYDDFQEKYSISFLLLKK